MPFFNPSLDDMSKEVLAWDLYTMLEGKVMYSLQDVPVRFSSVDQYLDVFEPLLLEECRAQTLRSLHENSSIEHHLQLMSVEAADPFRIIQFEAPAESSTKPMYFDTDLVFVSHEPLDLYTLADDDDDAAEQERPGSADGGGEGAAEGSEAPKPKPSGRRLKGQQFHALALVSASSPGTLALKLYLPEEPTARLPPSQHKRLQMLRKVMVPASGKWWIRKLGNMVTINREFQALYSLRELALSHRLLAPGGTDGSAPPPSLQPPPTLLKAIESTHNPSQLLAIRTCLCGRGVTLIQGPPGTGKTKTILGILSVLLASESSQGRRDATIKTSSRVPQWPAEKLNAGMRAKKSAAGTRSAASSGKAAASRAGGVGGAAGEHDGDVEEPATKTRRLLASASPWLQLGQKPSSLAPLPPSSHDGIFYGGGSNGGNGNGAGGSHAGNGAGADGGVSAFDAGARHPAASAPDGTLPPHPFPKADAIDRLIHLGRAEAEAPPKHVLVCAPSNAAIDEIVSRLLQHTGPGMLNERGESFLPTVVRVGPNIKETLMEVALDTLAKKRQAEHNDGGGAALTYVSRSSTGAQQHTLPSTADRLPPSPTPPIITSSLPLLPSTPPLAGTTRPRCRSSTRRASCAPRSRARATRCSRSFGRASTRFSSTRPRRPSRCRRSSPSSTHAVG